MILNPFLSLFQSRIEENSAEMPKGLMREVLETYKPHKLSRRKVQMGTVLVTPGHT